MKKNLSVDQKVRIVRVGSDRLANATGTILGKSMVDVIDYYIVGLDNPFADAKAVTITESCLEVL